MSALTLTLRHLPEARVDLAMLAPALATQGVDGLARLPLRIGAATVALGELFGIQGSDPTQVVLSGDLRRFDRLAADLTGGTWRIDGPAGAYLAQGMAAGSVSVHGPVGPHAACMLRGGSIEIHGDAGDFLGGALPGAMQGMQGGQVVVHGDVGARCADRMRRGAILVSGRVGEYAASRMLAGTLLALQGCGAHAGYAMRRGTLLVQGDCRPDATFADCGAHRLSMMHLLFRSWLPLGAPFAALAGYDRAMQRYLGDRAADGKGEILHLT